MAQIVDCCVSRLRDADYVISATRSAACCDVVVCVRDMCVPVRQMPVLRQIDPRVSIDCGQYDARTPATPFVTRM